MLTPSIYGKFVIWVLFSVGFPFMFNTAIIAGNVQSSNVYGVAIDGYDPVAYFTENRPDDSLKWYEKVREYDPYLSPVVYMNMGIAYYLIDDDEQAIYWLKEAAFKWPTFLGCHILLASIYWNADEKEKAEGKKEKILSLSPFFKIDFYGQAYQNPDHRDKIVTGLRKAGLT